jgi:hypothetical protein
MVLDNHSFTREHLLRRKNARKQIRLKLRFRSSFVIRVRDLFCHFFAIAGSASLYEDPAYRGARLKSHLLSIVRVVPIGQRYPRRRYFHARLLHSWNSVRFSTHEAIAVIVNSRQTHQRLLETGPVLRICGICVGQTISHRLDTDNMGLCAIKGTAGGLICAFGGADPDI